MTSIPADPEKPVDPENPENPDESVIDDTNADSRVPGDNRPAQPWPQRHHGLVMGIGIACVALGMMLFWSAFHIDGHGSGDDFALYINQARAMIQGDVGRTIAGNHYAVDNSAWQTFSPYTYPWGLPLLLAPVMAITGSVDWTAGVDYGPMKTVISLTLAFALLAYFAVLRRRVHIVGAVLLPLFFATNFWYVTHTDQVLSEFPFLMCVMVFLLWLDRVRERGLLDGDQVAPLVVIGLIACYTFNTRREGVGVLIGLLAAQAALAWHRSNAESWDERRRLFRALNWRALATPWVTFVGAAAAFQLLLPSDLLPNYEQRAPGNATSLSNLPDNLRVYRPLLAEQLGFKDAGVADITLFQSDSLGSVALATFVVAAIVGIVLCTITAPRRDAALIGTFIGVGGVVSVAPFADYRYLMSLLPLLAYFAFQGVSIPLRLILRKRFVTWPTLLAELALVGLIMGGWPDTKNAYDYRSAWVGPQNGPQEAATLEMWQAVRRETRGDSVIVYNRARTMALYTGRLSVQGGAIDFTERAGDYYVMYLDSDGTPGDYSQYPLTDAEAAERGFNEVWRNAGYVIWQIPGRDS